MTHKIECGCERISLQDIAEAEKWICGSDWINKLWTYELCIASDTVADSEETRIP